VDEMSLNIDHVDAVDAVESAYQLLLEFQALINNNEGDHPMAKAVDKWLTWYERNET
jgi:hypothetical protein